jgi:hypothetical protein
VAQLAAGSDTPQLSLDATALNKLKAGTLLPVVLFNSLGWDRSDFVSVLINRTDLIVLDENNALLASQINPVPQFSLEFSPATSQRFYFQAKVPALGITTVFVAVDAARAHRGQLSSSIADIASDSYRLHFDGTGRLASLSNLHSNITRSVAQDFLQYVSASQSEQNSGAYVFRPEQGNRIGVGSDNDGGHPYVSSTWKFIDAYSAQAKVTAFLTPAADATYLDTFAANVRTSSPTQLTVTTGRVDGKQPTPDPWGQSISHNFLPFDLTAAPPRGFQLGAQTVGSSPSASYRIVAFDFPKPYSAPPRVLLTARASVDNDDLFVLSVVDVTAKARANARARLCIYVCVCMYVCIYIFAYIYIFLYIYMYIYMWVSR